MKNSKIYSAILAFVLIAFLPHAAVSDNSQKLSKGDKQWCETSNFDWCFFTGHEKTVEVCAIESVNKCKSGDRYFRSPLRQDSGISSSCNALAHKTVFWTDSDTLQWKKYKCCQRYETETCYDLEASKEDSERNGLSALENCAAKASATCQESDPLSKRAPSLISEGFAKFVGIIIALGIGLCLLCLWSISFSADQAKRRASFTALRNSLMQKYAADEFFISKHDKSFVAINHASRKVSLGANGLEKTYSFDQIGKIELIKNESILNTVNRDSQAAGALLGGALFGGAGAIIGGLSASSTSKETVNKLTLRITVDDTAQPYWDVLFFTAPSKNGISPDQEPVASAMKKLDRLNALFFNILHRKL